LGSVYYHVIALTETSTPAPATSYRPPHPTRGKKHAFGPRNTISCHDHPPRLSAKVFEEQRCASGARRRLLPHRLRLPRPNRPLGAAKDRTHRPIPRLAARCARHAGPSAAETVSGTVPECWLQVSGAQSATGALFIASRAVRIGPTPRHPSPPPGPRHVTRPTPKPSWPLPPSSPTPPPPIPTSPPLRASVP